MKVRTNSVSSLPVARCVIPVLIFLLTGCSVLFPSSNVSWSENYALVKNGGECSVREMADGNLETFGEIGIHAVTTPPATRSRWIGFRRKNGLEVHEGELKTTHQVSVRFLQQRTVDRIVIHAEDLGPYEVFYRDMQSEWHQLASGRHRGDKPIQIDTHIVTPLLLIESTPTVMPKKSAERDGSEIRLRQINLSSTGKIAEIEVYGKVYDLSK